MQARRSAKSPSKHPVSEWGPVLLLALLAIHWTNQFIGTYGLMFDEAQYWLWAKTPAFGYFSKPPLIAWLIALSTSIFGDGVLGVKFFSPLIHLATGCILFRTALLQGESRETAWWVLVTYITLPFVIASGAFFATDTPLMFFWAASMYSVIRALKTQSLKWWLLAGIFSGLGCLSKYTMGVFALSTLLVILSRKDYRKSLLTPAPWLAALIAAAIFAPNLWWNSQHHFATLAHTQDNMFTKHLAIYPADLLAFFLSQFGVFGPLLMGALLASIFLWKGKRTLKLYTWPLIIIGLVVSLFAGAQAQWIAPAYTGGTLLIVPWLRNKAPRVLSASLILHLLVLVMFYSAPAVLNQVSPGDNALTRLFVWNELTPYAAKWQQKYPQAVIVSDERKIASALTYGLREQGRPHLVYKWNPAGRIADHYDLLSSDYDLSGKKLLLVTRHQEPSELKQLAPKAKLLEEFSLGKKFHFYIYLVNSFAGYDRPVI